ncbi:30S ribosomal protein S9 [Candidatus Uhrbacteria bacterium CG_4_9_14_3_um_filter_36_7]|uniref:Small ribosomal subunit protein uS9 n=1 Tax=Candidatus Uhrbacteria bacterium CG_4_9_14_3_um_filter_36_7 TaxID=1975033 RepID=A0A2M7XI46_9BACT|nr:MAG: 30S ribosomal protein S9 [Candidatus Uhrbacteria bacterium CG_4_9_14_3_um_filter_36_7]
MTDQVQEKEKKYVRAIGRRKRSVAQVRLFEKGEGKISINKIDVKDRFRLPELQQVIISPLTTTGTEGKFDFDIWVQGGGVRGQAESIRLGIARTLILLNPEFRPTLKKLGFLTRDARSKERKKYGLKKARRAPQWSKR